MIQSLNPANGQVLRRFEPLTPLVLEGKLALAAVASKTYAAETLEQRRFWMRRLALLLEGDRDDLATIIVLEMGKPISVAQAEVDKCAAACRYYAENAARILEPEPIATEHAQSFVRWDPLGVVLAVMPWNFPFWQVFRFLAPALMAGNVVLLKHAPNVPQCALAIETMVRRAGFPRGSIQSMLVEATEVEKILADDRIAAVTVTGSEAAGRAVAAQAGYLIKKSVLELGGSDPFLVLPSADLPSAIANAVKARCINNGQSCIAAKRFVVHEDVYEEFERGLVEGMQGLKIGDPMREETELGPLATAGAADKLLQQIAASLESGGRLLTGGERLPGEGFFVEPTVIADVPRGCSVCAEETFGPLALLFRVGSLDEAIEVANATPFGLGASCWTTNLQEQQRLEREIQAGAVFFNTPVASDPRLPFGGIKRSGYGRELSAAGMREFMNAKTVVVAEAKDAPHQTDFTFTPDPAAKAPSPVASAPVTVTSTPANAEEPERRKGSLLGLSGR
ncbi:MAG TPA: NAD-dependent succinate-semialdehyde dehydrogenase [Acidobacteriaceae bacterium]|nr:NAD-dependent succinate-semialdehyde dehydrogenase [Acidobacteriaceae bacterium]